MKVFVAQDHPYDGGVIRGIFTSIEEMKQYHDAHIDDDNYVPFPPERLNEYTLNIGYNRHTSDAEYQWDRDKQTMVKIDEYEVDGET